MKKGNQASERGKKDIPPQVFSQGRGRVKLGKKKKRGAEGRARNHRGRVLYRSRVRSEYSYQIVREELKKREGKAARETLSKRISRERGGYILAREDLSARKGMRGGYRHAFRLYRSRRR